MGYVGVPLKMMIVRLPQEEKDKVIVLAEREGLSPSMWVRKAIESYSRGVEVRRGGVRVVR